jgi:hypothetical protein
MEVILDKDTGRVYVKREATPSGVAAQQTHQFAKFGITLVWDGSGNLLGVEFASEHREPAIVRTVSSEELARREGLVTGAVP